MLAVIALHGGAGTLRKSDMTRRRAARYRAALQDALMRGYSILQSNGTGLDAVTAAVVAMEDSPLFNAGRGAVYNAEGRHELDAAIMDGATLRAGAVACVGRIRNPVLAARAVMEHSRHVLLAGRGAERFARARGLAMVSPGYFATRTRLTALRHKLVGHHGTVGAVALDRDGHLAAATSTGGLTAKTPGRVGDTPVFGAGTWADDATCAVSATGQGELFIRTAAAHEIDARMRWGGQSLEFAATEVIEKILAPIGGDGGLVAVDAKGNIALPFNCSGMYRGYVRGGEATLTSAIHREPWRTEAV
jgi:isoaspartyl peptidase/L-asparaginase-like protein (Ntn-hydrolase superfamily)